MKMNRPTPRCLAMAMLPVVGLMACHQSVASRWPRREAAGSAQIPAEEFQKALEGAKVRVRYVTFLAMDPDRAVDARSSSFTMDAAEGPYEVETTVLPSEVSVLAAKARDRDYLCVNIDVDLSRLAVEPGRTAMVIAIDSEGETPKLPIVAEPRSGAVVALDWRELQGEDGRVCNEKRRRAAMLWEGYLKRPD
jgi:hypothetical protein